MSFPTTFARVGPRGVVVRRDVVPRRSRRVSRVVRRGGVHGVGRRAHGLEPVRVVRSLPRGVAPARRLRYLGRGRRAPRPPRPARTSVGASRISSSTRDSGRRGRTDGSTRPGSPPPRRGGGGYRVRRRRRPPRLRATRRHRPRAVPPGMAIPERTRSSRARRRRRARRPGASGARRRHPRRAERRGSASTRGRRRGGVGEPIAGDGSHRRRRRRARRVEVVQNQRRASRRRRNRRRRRRRSPRRRRRRRVATRRVRAVSTPHPYTYETLVGPRGGVRVHDVVVAKGARVRIRVVAARGDCLRRRGGIRRGKTSCALITRDDRVRALAGTDPFAQNLQALFGDGGTAAREAFDHHGAILARGGGARATRSRGSGSPPDRRTPPRRPSRGSMAVCAR